MPPRQTVQTSQPTRMHPAIYEIGGESPLIAALGNAFTVRRKGLIMRLLVPVEYKDATGVQMCADDIIRYVSHSTTYVQSTSTKAMASRVCSMGSEFRIRCGLHRWPLKSTREKYRQGQQLGGWMAQCTDNIPYLHSTPK